MLNHYARRMCAVNEGGVSIFLKKGMTAMRKKSALFLAALFLLALFAGCSGGGGGTTPTAAPSTPAPGGSTSPTEAPDQGGSETPAPAPGGDDDSPYNFAIGKYATDAEGWPLEKYEYELPLSTTDEVFTTMTLSFTPQYLPEGGMIEMPMYKGMEELTGVHMEYNIIASASFVETLSVMEASDEMCDITAGFYAYHQGSSLNAAIEEELVINHYDWKEYAPNYCRWAKDYEWLEGMWSNVNNPGFDKWIGFVEFNDEPNCSTGYFVRGDWLDELGLNSLDVYTYDEWHDMLMAIKTAGFENCEYPLQVYSNIDAYVNVWNGFNTSPYAAAAAYLRVVDGKVNFNGMADDDLVLMQYLRQWFVDGLISPYFQSLTGLEDITADVTNGNCGCAFFSPGEIQGTESSCVNPNARFDVMRKLVRQRGDIIHWHLDPDEFGGCGASISAKCENIPLMVTWCDWAYSPFGADYRNYGPEGVYWNYNENGEREWNEIITGFELGSGWATIFYLQNPMDPGIDAWTRNYKYPGGERLLHFYDVWNEVLDYYDGAYNYPGAIKLSDDDNAEINNLRADANTFFAENYVLFLLGDKSFSEWDSFQEQLNALGMARITEIYQEAYDEYMAA